MNFYLFGSISGYPFSNGEGVKGKGNGVIKGKLMSKFGNSGLKSQGMQGCGISKEPTVGVSGADMMGFEGVRGPDD